MRLKRPLLIAGIILVTLMAIGRILPAATEAVFLGIRKSTAAFDAAAVRDGTYEGSSFVLPVSVRVRVSVAGGRIGSIDILKHFNGQGKAAEAIVQHVIEKQSLGVDVVAGATYSSYAILKAIEDALQKGSKQ